MAYHSQAYDLLGTVSPSSGDRRALFFQWWIPLLIIVLAFMVIRAIREEGATAVIETSLENPEFYSHAILSGTMKVFAADRNHKRLEREKGTQRRSFS
jgi:hypothetical protein